MSRLVFYAHAAKELSLSHFVHNIGCDQAMATSELLIYIHSGSYSHHVLKVFERK